MDCPNCGAQTVPDQQYCRDCGDALTISAQRRRIPRAFWGLAMAFAGILISLTGSMIEVRAVIFLGVFMSILGMFAIAAMSMFNQGTKRIPRSFAKPESLPKATATNKLSPMPAADHFASVTENTTDLLERQEPKSTGGLAS